MATVIDGKATASKVIDEVTREAASLEQLTGIKPGLAVLVVGDDPASHVYVNSKSNMAKACGFKSVQHTFPKETSHHELEELISGLNADPSIHGILVQLPLPPHLDAGKIIALIASNKDVDGLHVVNAGKVATGDFVTGLVSCTPAGAMLLVENIHGRDLSGLNAVVVGRSNLFGKPMGLLLLGANATVTIAHSRTSTLPAICRTADILVAAVGQPQMVKADWVKAGATVIDVGINRLLPGVGEGGKSRLVGDVAYPEVSEIAGAITPVPGGVGPMTIAMLMRNTLLAATRAAALFGARPAAKIGR